MNASQIITTARSQAHTSTTLVTDAEALVLLNFVYYELLNVIKRDVGEDFLYQEFYQDLVYGVNEYQYTTPGSTVDSQDKLIRVGLKYYQTQTLYTIAKPISLGSLKEDLAYYEQHQPPTAPFFIPLNNRIAIYPSPLFYVPSGIRIGTLLNLKDLLLTSAETDIFIPREQHYVIILGLMEKFFERRGLTEEQSLYAAKYIAAKRTMVKVMSDVVEGPMTVQIPDLSYYD